MNVFKKVQNLSEGNRKIILWTVVVIVGISLLAWWLGSIEKRLETLQVEELKEQIGLTDFKQEIDKIPEMPKFEMPKIIEEYLKKLKEAKLKEAELKEAELKGAELKRAE